MAFGPLFSHLDKNNNIWGVFVSNRIGSIEINSFSKPVIAIGEYILYLRVKLLFSQLSDQWPYLIVNFTA